MRRCDHCGANMATRFSSARLTGSRRSIRKPSPERSLRSATDRPRSTSKSFPPCRRREPIGFLFRRAICFSFRLKADHNQILNALIPLLGPFGGGCQLVRMVVFPSTKSMISTNVCARHDPESLLRDSEKNFRLHLAEIRQVVIEPADASSFQRQRSGTRRPDDPAGRKMEVCLCNACGYGR